MKSLESSRSVAPLDPKHELLYELLCSSAKKSWLIPPRHTAGARSRTRFALLARSKSTEDATRDGTDDRIGASDEALRPDAVEQGGPFAR